MRVGATTSQYKSLDLSHGRTRYLEAGEGPAVILLHGVSFSLGGDAWLANVNGLASGLKVLAPDFPGWGPGDQLELGYSFAYLADFVREFQDSLNLGRSHIVGHSMGGWVASVLAYESPQRVGRLVLVASGGMATRPLATMTTWQPPSEQEIQSSLSGLERAGIGIAPLVKERVTLAGDPQRAERFRRIMEHMTHPETRRRYHMGRRLPHIPNETLILWGIDDEVNDIEMGRATQRLIPHSELRTFDRTGHNIPTERPDEFNQAVLGFLSP
jgi:pimeloyl-ACP methyl ester carboxylesterase